MTLSEMRRILAERGIQLTKSLGQNFLHDGNQLRRLVAEAELKPTAPVLEIGPGLGPLTELLVEEPRVVLAIEKDARLVELLCERFHVGRSSRLSPHSETETGTMPGLRLLHADALEILRGERRDWSGWKLVSNLPYSVASTILVELATTPQPPDRIVATLQLEVAQRLMAQAGEDGYGVLSLLVQLRYEARGWFKIPASCFFPAPDVDSACIRLFRRERELLPLERHHVFARLVKLAFSQRRKMLFKLLKSQWPAEELRAEFERLGLSLQVRAEAVSLEQFVRLAQIHR